MEDFLPFLSQTWSSLENHKINYLTNTKNFFLSSLAWRRSTSDICYDCPCLPKRDKPKYFHETGSSSFSFRIISFLESQSSGSWRPPSPSLDFFLLASLCSELGVRQCYRLLLLLVLLKTSFKVFLADHTFFIKTESYPDAVILFFISFFTQYNR